jgi:glycosyltransferase family protein
MSILHVWGGIKMNQSLNQIHFTFYSDEELLRKINEENVALARFGDGEIAIILERGAPAFQDINLELQERLKEIIMSDLPHIFIGIPKYFNDTNPLHYYSKSYWDAYIENNTDFIQSLNTDKTYANTGVTRPYIDLADRTGCKTIFDLFKNIWEKKKVLIVEGKKSRFGINNDLLREANEVHRILCPETNAYSEHESYRYRTLRY